MLNWLRSIFSRTVLTADVAHAAIKRTVAEAAATLAALRAAQ